MFLTLARLVWPKVSDVFNVFYHGFVLGSFMFVPLPAIHVVCLRNVIHPLELPEHSAMPPLTWQEESMSYRGFAFHKLYDIWF